MDDPADAFLRRLDDAATPIADEADAEAGFPVRAFARLRAIGALTAALPEREGGFGLGVERQGLPAARFLRLLGRGSVSVGRLVEGHVNALRLVFRYGDDRQRREAAAAAREGRLFGIWVTDGGAPLALRHGVLAGGKAFCSGAGHVSRALVTADRAGSGGDGEAPVMLLCDVEGAARGEVRALSGVRGAVTADMALDGIAPGAAIGAPGDYLRQPEFSAGAWRGSAVACGAIEALADETVRLLVARGRHRNPHQAARLGRLVIARDTAIAWVERAAVAADGADPGRVVATINLARLAVEATALDAIPLAQRSLGLQAMLAGSRVERLVRDLSTYLRQPAPDETLTEAAIWFAENRA